MGGEGGPLLEAGAVVRFQGATHQVVGYEADGQIRLRDGQRGERVLDPGDLVGDPSFGFEGQDAAPLPPAQAFWDRLDPEVKAGALVREEHVREVLTGYRLGQPDDRFPGEPRPAYQEGTSSEHRVHAKAAELGVSGRQIYRWMKDYRAAGHHPAALVSGHQTRTSSRLGDDGLKLSEAILRVARQRQEDADLSFTSLRGLVQRELEAMGYTEVTLPTHNTFNKLVRRFAPELTHNAKRRRSEASRGTKRPFGKVVCVRPGQYVLIDITPFDLLARSEVDGRELRLRMVIALDLYSRAIVAARLIEVEPQGVDVTTLLLDIVHPVRAHPSWPPLPEGARLPYLGIPEGVMLAAHDMPEGTPLLNIPPVLPEAVVVDNGMVFLSGQFRDLCARLGTDIMLARPGTGSDKAHVERLFLHIRHSLAERLEGHVGPHVLARGLRPRALHFPWELQFELTQWVARYYNHRPHDGLYHPRTPKLKLTPAEMFAFGVSHAGHLTVPLGRDAYYLALRTELRVISDTGVRVDGSQYDSEVFNPYRNADSPYLEFGKRWPVKVDPRDPTVIHFQDPLTLAWHEVPERDADWRSRPFQGELADHVKAVLEERQAAREQGDRLEAVRQEMDSAYRAKVEESLKLTEQTRRRALSTPHKQDVARREAARAQQEAMTGKPRVSWKAKDVAAPAPVEEPLDDGGLFEIVGDDF
ncbi:hypothetical protein QR90_05105 [Deinococcus radiopugnans]|uniref:Integrase catalytic domain-containing protein n=1 Tax=Deinococcus radiopugnans TaxID=57497 RepID=A0A0A7KJ74_9DEIO|nr:DDE-type integrase/transposase/recombinase [Deinococcus radiopugnans]AIZ44603.1 hypothetical protein QR90_05105 [Deinococcus radiopugnans]